MNDLHETLQLPSASQLEQMAAAGDPAATVLMKLGIDKNTVLRARGGTIIPRPSRPQTQDDIAIAALQELVIGTGGNVDFEVHDTLGQGGMGIVRLASQTSLGRHVAIKSVRDMAQVDEASLALLREAWVTGALEHPNIVPVHTLGRDRNGSPMFVMKRVEGTSWEVLLEDPSRLPEEAREDPLSYHIEVFQQVCNAVAFAHSKRILHRDLKPENVMVGPFGEVYLLDWGLAVSLAEEPGRIPLAREISSVAGTLPYMAPEMVSSDGDSIDERTDIYLLGAVLHEVLTGTFRHDGDSALAMIAAAWRSEPVTYPSHVPAELGAIANRACAKEHADRFQSVPELKAAVTAWGRHRNSVLLCDAAHVQLEELRQLIEDDDDPTAVHDTFAACRVGFQAALQSWPESPAARAGLQAAIVAMVDAEIRAGHLTAATSLAATLPDPEPAIDARLEQLRTQKQLDAERAAQLQRMEQQNDLRYGTRTRAFIALMFAGTFGLGTFAVGIAERAGLLVYAHEHNIIASVTFLGMIAAIYRWAHETLTRTAFNRKISRSLFAIAICCVLLTFALWWSNLPPRACLPISLLLFAAYMGTLAATLDTRLFVSAAVHTVCCIGSVLWPQWGFEWVGFSHLASSFLVAWIWRPEKIRGDYDGHTSNVV